MENVRNAPGGDLEGYDLEILLRRPSLRSNLPRRVSQIRSEKISSEETNCGIGCVRGQWIQSFANRNSFTFIFGILGSFYGAYHAYFFGVITTLEKRFKISSQTVGVIAATGDVTQVLACFFISQCMSNVHKPKWVALGVIFIAASTVVFTLPHFLYEPESPKSMVISRYSTYVRHCANGSEVCTEDLERFIPIVFLILAQILSGIGGSLSFTFGSSYEDDNIEKYKPPPLLILLSVLKILGPAFGYWLSSMSLKFYEYPGLISVTEENDPRWVGAWWLGSLIIGFILIVPGFFISLFPNTLQKTVFRRIQSKQNEVPVPSQVITERKGKLTFKRFFTSSAVSGTHFATIFNLLGFPGHFIFLPKYVETQYRLSASNANFIAGLTTLISSAFGTVTAHSVITRYRLSARILASWTVLVGILSIGGVLSYVFLDCQANDNEIEVMFSQYPVVTCMCDNSSFFPVCDQYNKAYISLCHAKCENILNNSSTAEFINCTSAAFPSTRIMFKGFCPVDCGSDFIKFTIITCSITFFYATGRISNYWFETKSEEIHPNVLSLGMIFGTVVSLPLPIIYGYILDHTCLLWEGNCEWSQNCWIYNNEKVRFYMNISAATFAAIGVIFDIVIWFSVKNLVLFEDNYNIKGRINEK